MASTLADWGRLEPAEVETVVLLTSEVVTNAVLHAGPHRSDDELVVTLDHSAGLVRVEVTDHHPDTSRIDRAAGLGGGSGRGLLLLDALATRWGAMPTGTGKVVWFVVQA